MRPTLEIFYTTINADAVLFRREVIDLTPVGQAADYAVRAIVGLRFPRHGTHDLVMHGTSWRYDPVANDMPHTFLVYAHSLAVASAWAGDLADVPEPLPAAQIGTSVTPLSDIANLPVAVLRQILSADAAAPSQVPLDTPHVLGHALAHLSFLVRTNHVVRSTLAGNPLKLKVIQGIEDRVAGSIEHAPPWGWGDPFESEDRLTG